MIIEFNKREDGRVVLKCVRDDGSNTWQRQEDTHAVFFPLHDLTNYVVETELGFRRGFFGLVAEGWDIAETTGKGARGQLPDETLEVEYLVSAFSAERSSGAPATAEEFNQLAATFAEAKGMPRPRQLTELELERVRMRFNELAMEWRSLPPDEALRLEFLL